MNENTVHVVSWNGFAELLDGPLSRGMCGHIDVKQPSTGMFDHHKHVEYAKGGGDSDAEVTCDNPLGVIADKGRPALRLATSTRAADTVIRHVFAHRSWRDFE